MRAFVWTMLVVLAIDVIGKACMLWQRDFTRNPSHMVSDILFCFGFALWAAYLLGTGG